MTIFGFVIGKKSKFVSKADYEDLVLHLNEIDEVLISIGKDIEPIKAFMQEHSDLILEADKDFADTQRRFNTGLQDIMNFTPKAALEFTKKRGE